MKKFKDVNNKVHEIEEGFEHLLPVGATEITDAEAISLLTPSLQEAKELKILDLYQDGGLHILSGFTSDALGVVNTYPSADRDQANLNGVVTESIISAADVNWKTPFWCADSNGTWDRRLHTHAEIQQVGKAAAVHVRNAQDKLKTLVDKVNDQLTDTQLKIDAVVW